MYVRMYECMNVCRYDDVRTYVCTYFCMYVCMYGWMDGCMYVLTCVRACVCVYVYMCADRRLRWMHVSKGTLPYILAYYENTPIQVYRKFHLQKLKCSNEKNEIFHFLLKIDCGYSLEPPRRGDSNECP